MNISRQEDGSFTIDNLDREDLQGISTMIASAKLPERRRFNSLLEALKKHLNL